VSPLRRALAVVVAAAGVGLVTVPAALAAGPAAHVAARPAVAGPVKGITVSDLHLAPWVGSKKQVYGYLTNTGPEVESPVVHVAYLDANGNKIGSLDAFPATAWLKTGESVGLSEIIFPPAGLASVKLEEVDGLTPQADASHHLPLAVDMPFPASGPTIVSGTVTLDEPARPLLIKIVVSAFRADGSLAWVAPTDATGNGDIIPQGTTVPWLVNRYPYYPAFDHVTTIAEINETTRPDGRAEAVFPSYGPGRTVGSPRPQPAIISHAPAAPGKEDVTPVPIPTMSHPSVPGAGTAGDAPAVGVSTPAPYVRPSLAAAAEHSASSPISVPWRNIGVGLLVGLGGLALLLYVGRSLRRRSSSV